MHLTQNKILSEHIVSNISPKHQIKVNLTNRKKTIAIKITDKDIIVNAPKFASTQIITDFLTKNSNWIERKIRQLTKSNNNYGSDICFLGKKVPFIETTETNLIGLKFIDNKLLHSKSLNLKQKEFLLKEWYKHQAIKHIKPRVIDISQTINLLPQNIEFKFFKSQWGNCNRKKEIKLNILLIRLPILVIDYVIIHELCHLQEMNHSLKFWKLVKQYYPQYKQANAILKNNAPILY